MDTSLNINQKASGNTQTQAETAGTIANTSSNSTPSPLFNIAPAAETAGTIASSTSSTSVSGGGFCANA